MEIWIFLRNLGTIFITGLKIATNLKISKLKKIIKIIFIRPPRRQMLQLIKFTKWLKVIIWELQDQKATFNKINNRMGMVNLNSYLYVRIAKASKMAQENSDPKYVTTALRTYQYLQANKQ